LGFALELRLAPNRPKLPQKGQLTARHQSGIEALLALGQTMYIRPFLLMASFMPAPLNSQIDKILAARKADPEHWQTTPLPPIPLGCEPWPTRSRQEIMEEAIQTYFRKHPDQRKYEVEVRKRLLEGQPKKP
jgi:hypothetical protein